MLTAGRVARPDHDAKGEDGDPGVPARRGCSELMVQKHGANVDSRIALTCSLIPTTPTEEVDEHVSIARLEGRSSKQCSEKSGH